VGDGNSICGRVENEKVHPVYRLHLSAGSPQSCRDLGTAVENGVTYCNKTPRKIKCRDVGDYFDSGAIIDCILSQILQLLSYITELFRHVTKLVIDLCGF
jgi:hypothetical protein